MCVAAMWPVLCRKRKRRVREEIALPAGYVIEWGGDFENLQSASLRLAIITPVVLLLIWILLYSSFGSMRLALLIFIAVPIAASGGVIALWIRENAIQYFRGSRIYRPVRCGGLEWPGLGQCGRGDTHVWVVSERQRRSMRPRIGSVRS